MRLATRRTHLGAAVAASACLLASAGGASAQAARPASASAAGIYTCIDDQGRRLTSDRPIPACIDREQRVLNRDGSLKSVHPPSLTADERAEKEARERRAAEARAAQADAVRRDRNLLLRYPTEERHRQAREAALEPVRVALRSSEARLQVLAGERKPLMDEAEFYVGREMPARLKAQLDANDAATEAQRAAAASQMAELERVKRFYDAELERLRKLWAGAQPGSLGPIHQSQADASAVNPALR
ncbi:MAG: DUF4124 domain-containing protein [Rubrivivax sp.]|jgi:hypothetical protein|nr:DUF4124 domain-containing protein [Rubrivivax sp.]